MQEYMADANLNWERHNSASEEGSIEMDKADIQTVQVSNCNQIAGVPKVKKLLVGNS